MPVAPWAAATSKSWPPAMALGLAPMPRLIASWLQLFLAGGVLKFKLHIVLRRAPPPERLPAQDGPLRRSIARWCGRVITAERWRIRHKGSLPYGVAIACGGAWVTLAGVGG